MHHNTRKTLPELSNNPNWLSQKNIFLIDCENYLLDNDCNWLDDTRIHIWTPCVSNVERANCYHFWFDWMQEIEKSLNYISQLQPTETKRYFFDALLGTQRLHKNLVHGFIQNYANKDKFLISYTGNPFTSPESNWIKSVDNEIPGQLLTYNKTQQANSSCVIPYLIYNQCWYSLVAETVGSYPNFYTEKTGKPLLSKRLFVMFAAKHHLKHLRDFGFKTFDGIIDESYDNIEDQETRYQQAWKQVEFLMNQNPLAIYEQAECVLDHNYNHFMNTDWKKDMHKRIKKISQSSK